MLNHETVNRLRYMKLTGMADSLKEQDDDSAFQEMGFYDRLGLMVDREFNKRQHSRLQRLVSRARFQNTTACVEDIRYDDDRRLDRGFIMELASCNYMRCPPINRQSKHRIIFLFRNDGSDSFRFLTGLPQTPVFLRR